MHARAVGVVLSLGLAPWCLAASADVEALLANMRKAYAAVKSARLVTQTVRNGQGPSVNATVTTNYIAPLNVHFAIRGMHEAPKGGQAVVVTDGKRIQYHGFSGPANEIRYQPDRLNVNLPINLETINFYDYKRQLSTERGGNMRRSSLKIVKGEVWKDKTWTVLEETVDNLLIRYFVDPKTFLMHRTVMSGLKTKRLLMDAVIVDMRVNAPVDPKLFKLKALSSRKANF